jgi:hypothetical protein
MGVLLGNAMVEFADLIQQIGAGRKYPSCIADS